MPTFNRLVGTNTNGDLPDVVTAGLDARTDTRTRRTRRVWAVGDSHTLGAGSAGGGLASDAAVVGSSTLLSQPLLTFQGGSWVEWAILASEARWTFAGLGATAGYTAAQILATHVPTIIAEATPGDTVVVHAGTNGAGTNFADIGTIHDTLRAAGLNTIAVTTPPNAGGSLANTMGMNEYIKRYASDYKVPIADVFAAVVDPATGAWDSSLNGDGTHGNQAGQKVMGETIAATLNALFDEPVSLIQANAAFTGQFLTKPLGLGAPVSGTDYGWIGAPGTSTVTFPTDSRLAGDSSYLWTRGDTNVNSRYATFTLTPGNRMRFGAAIEVTASGTASWQFGIQGHAVSQRYFVFGYGSAIDLPVGLSRFYIEFDVPSGLPSYLVRVGLNLNAAGMTMVNGELTMMDLTALGLA